MMVTEAFHSLLMTATVFSLTFVLHACRVEFIEEMFLKPQRMLKARPLKLCRGLLTLQL